MYDPFVLNEIPNLTAKSILDCGCGNGIWGYLMRVNRSGNEACMVGLDCTLKYLKFNKKHKVYDDLVMGDCAYLPFRDASFDLVLASEVIEHLPRINGNKFLDDVERICRDRIVITAPQGFAPREVPNGLQADMHRSTWTSTDFKKRGYKVRGIGFRFFKLWLGTRFLFVYGTLFYFATPFSWLLPSLAEYLIAQKVPRWKPPTRYEVIVAHHMCAQSISRTL